MQQRKIYHVLCLLETEKLSENTLLVSIANIKQACNCTQGAQINTSQIAWTKHYLFILES